MIMVGCNIFEKINYCLLFMSTIAIMNTYVVLCRDTMEGRNELQQALEAAY